jgi:hypothetical protein
VGLNTPTVGGNAVLATLLSDPAAASNLASVLALADARNMSGLFALQVQGLNLLLNPSGNWDQQRAAPGTTGVPSVVTESTKATYSCAIGATSLAATATDFWSLVGSSSKTVRLLRIALSGIATTAGTSEIYLFKRTTANSSGTSSQPTIVQHDSNDAAPTAVVNSYSVNPTLGTGYALRSQRLALALTGSSDVPPIIWDFTNRNSKGLVLRGIAQCAALNFNGATVVAGTSLTIDVEWTEE